MSSMYQRPAFTEEPENQLSAVEMKNAGSVSYTHLTLPTTPYV